MNCGKKSPENSTGTEAAAVAAGAGVAGCEGVCWAAAIAGIALTARARTARFTMCRVMKESLVVERGPAVGKTTGACARHGRDDAHTAQAMCAQPIIEQLCTEKETGASGRSIRVLPPRASRHGRSRSAT